MEEKSENKISLKVLVNNLTNKVIFAECDNDFVDVLFSFLTIPMGTIVRLSHHSQSFGIGCIDNLFGSVESLDLQLFRTKECRDMLLHPRNGAEDLLRNLKLKYDQCEPPRYFKCSNRYCCNFAQRFSYYETVHCCCGGLMKVETIFTTKQAEGGGVFVAGPGRFIISDDLQVLPPFTCAVSSVVSNHGLMGWKSVEELTFNVGVDEVLNLLMRSLVSETPLTETLLKDKTIPNMIDENLDQDLCIEYREVEGKRNEEEEKISIKLIVSKSKKKVYYAEVGEDFVNLLFSFLTLPLGFVIKQMQHNSLKGCIDQLYKSVEDLDEQYLKSNLHKKKLVSPKLLPGFGYKNHLLGIEEASYKWTDSVEPKSHCKEDCIDFVDPKSHHKKDDKDCGFLKGPAMFMVTDSLNVSPISAIVGMSILCELNVPVTDVEVRVAHVGKEEAIRLLVASFVCPSALTSVFLTKPKRFGGLGCLSFLI
ncbi:uncharacterized protein LOC126589118 [Malus sylvestris]|nr:uncharacterized protein LOC103447457 isoform X1 [Malus domestica]XP_028944117.1 uncharacterized protein LOC103447457 isoform X1 [Malus domestica]XP_050110287.1 uncharacterized protein LOC126589118 [Malus sylvestris]